jgi:hypothetical protein
VVRVAYGGHRRQGRSSTWREGLPYGSRTDIGYGVNFPGPLEMVRSSRAKQANAAIANLRPSRTSLASTKPRYVCDNLWCFSLLHFDAAIRRRRPGTEVSKCVCDIAAAAAFLFFFPLFHSTSHPPRDDDALPDTAIGCNHLAAWQGPAIFGPEHDPTIGQNTDTTRHELDERRKQLMIDSRHQLEY